MMVIEVLEKNNDFFPKLKKAFLPRKDTIEITKIIANLLSSFVMNICKCILQVDN
jgi:hypothetical protein